MSKETTRPENLYKWEDNDDPKIEGKDYTNLDIKDLLQKKDEIAKEIEELAGFNILKKPLFEGDIPRYSDLLDKIFALEDLKVKIYISSRLEVLYDVLLDIEGWANQLPISFMNETELKGIDLEDIKITKNHLEHLIKLLLFYKKL